MESSDDDAPLVKERMNGLVKRDSGANMMAAVKTETAANGPTGKRKSRLSNGLSRQSKDDSGDEDDEPLVKRRKTATAKGISMPATGSESDSDVPLKKKKKVVNGVLSSHKKNTEAAPRSNGTTSKARVKNTKIKPETGSDSDNIPIARKVTKSNQSARKIGPKVAASKPKPKKNVKQEDTDQDVENEEEEEGYRWWEEPIQGDGTKKWTTLEHNGVVFPPPYEPLPSNVKLRYNGIPINLHPDAEEVATFYGTMLSSTANVENPTFNKNFFNDFKDILDRTGHGKDRDGNNVKIEEFEKCDFRPIFEHFEEERASKRALSTAEKKENRIKKAEMDAPYTYCLWDGRKQKVGNFRVEPPGLFRGRGEHPKTGRVKQRVKPDQVTINIGEEATVPPPPEGHRWRDVKHDQEATWLAMWQENINGNYKYVMLAANSDIKGQSDFKKFEKARELESHVARIRRDYRARLKSEAMADRQLATAVYLIDVFALRAGNEKGDDEADTVGCCSLKLQHITLKPPNKVIFDFLGKDSIRFFNEVEVDGQVFKNLRIFKKEPKKGEDELFDRVTTTSLNKHLRGYMEGLTAKVFRTYNASRTMATLLKEMKPTGTIAEKVRDYNEANRRVAIICNHKRTVAAGHEGQMEKLAERINGLRYQQWRLRQQMLNIDPKIKKKKGPEYFELPEDLTMDWVREHQAGLITEQREKIKKKFEKDNEKKLAEGEKKLSGKELDERLEAADELEKKFQKENKTGKVEAEGRGPTIEKLESNIEKLSARIETMKVQAEDKDNNKEVALGTSKINYIDPRLTVVFSKKFNVPIERLFSKTLREKFDWAIKSVDENWEF